MRSRRSKTKVKLLLSAVFFAILVMVVGVILIQIRFPIRYLDIIEENAGNLEPAFILAVIHAESSFRPNVVSHAGAMGLMQIMEDTGQQIAEKLRIEDYDTNKLFDPETNIRIGTYYLNMHWLNNNGDVTLILSSYNAGRGNVRNWLNDERFSEDGVTLSHIPFEETRNFVARVKRRSEIYTWMLWVYNWFR